jgi:hypothetical protein
VEFEQAYSASLYDVSIYSGKDQTLRRYYEDASSPFAHLPRLANLNTKDSKGSQRNTKEKFNKLRAFVTSFVPLCLEIDLIKGGEQGPVQAILLPGSESLPGAQADGNPSG